MTVRGASALHHPTYVKYLLALISAGFAVQIISVSVGWQIYEMTRNPLYLGYVGLVQFLPAMALVLFTGLAADKFNRRMIMAGCYVVEVGCGVALLWLTLTGSTAVAPIFIVLFAFGVARAFMNPAADALAPNLLPREAIPHGISLSSMQWQFTTIVGPVVGGLLYWFAPWAAYGSGLVLMMAALLLVFAIGRVPQPNHAEGTSIGMLLAGFKFIKSEPVVLGAISLDLFAVLLGGAVALMPVYAIDILHAGPIGLGLLRAAPGIGAVAVALWLAKFSIPPRAGIILFSCVAAFGVATIAFGISRWVPLSIVALIFVGGFDMVSVYVRETLMQLWTKDEVRGRVNAVNRVFIGASNELGEFRAGVMAAWLGATSAVVLGGMGSVAIAAIWARLFPKLRDIRTFEGKPLA